MNWPCKKLREKAVETVMEHIHYEDENTRYICIGPVNKVILERWQASMRTPFNCSFIVYYFHSLRSSMRKIILII